MALSYELFNGNGVNKLFSVNMPYLDKTHIALKVSGVSVSFTWVNTTLIQLDAAAALGVNNVRVQRTTPTKPLTDFSNGSTVIEDDLDRVLIQSLYLMEEAQDLAADSMRLNDTALYDANSKRIVNVADPVNPQDAATKAYGDANWGGAGAATAVAAGAAAALSAAGAATSATSAAASNAAAQAAAAGMKWRPSVRCATTTTISGVGAAVIDGVIVNAGDRVLVKDQTTPSQNGIYIASAGTWTRATDADTWAELVSQVVAVEQGATWADYTFICTADQGGTIEVTPVAWSTFKVVPADGSITATKLSANAIVGQTQDASPDTDNDYVLTYDTSALGLKKVVFASLDFLRKSLFTTKGDIAVSTGVGAPTRLSVGANGQALVADSAQASGVKWADVSGGLSYLSTPALSGGAFTFTGVMGATYDEYELVLADITLSAPLDGVSLQLSTDNGATWKTTGYVNDTTFVVGAAVGGATASTSGIELRLQNGGSVVTIHGRFTLGNANSTTQRFRGYGTNAVHYGTSLSTGFVNGRYDTVGVAVNAFRLVATTGTITGGQARLYGWHK